MGKVIRVGIVGARFAARIHYEGLRRVHGVPVEVVGVTSKTPEARDAFARQTGVQAFQTLEDLCEAVDVECVFHNREPLAGAQLGRDTIAVLYSAYLSAERLGTEVAIPHA